MSDEIRNDRAEVSRQSADRATDDDDDFIAKFIEELLRQAHSGDPPSVIFFDEVDGLCQEQSRVCVNENQ